MKNKSKFIVGSVSRGDRVAKMKIYDDISTWTADDFRTELEWLEYCGVKEVNLYINSMGGSVVDGLSIYGSIMSSDINFTTIIDGVAMSMGSVIWAAGSTLKMRDTGILMLHNPFVVSGQDDKDTQEFVNSFKTQLRTIYTKRFGLPEETVQSIMDGEEGVDGTYFTAEEAIEAGFLLSENVIETPPIIKENQLSNMVGSLKNKREYAEVLAKVVSEYVDDGTDDKKEKQPQNTKNTIISQNGESTDDNKAKTVKNKENKKDMEEKVQLFATALGCKNSTEDVLSQIKTLKEGAEKGVELNAKVEELQLEMSAKDTSIENLTKNLEEANKELVAYKEKEQKDLENKVECLIDDAIKNGKIQEEAKETWISYAKSNIEQVTSLLDSIVPVVNEKITEEIANDKEGVEKAEKSNKSTATLLSEKIRNSRGLGK